MYPNLTRNPERLSRIAENLKVVAHPVRIRIIALLCEKPHDVNTLADELQISHTVASQQLQILRMRKLIAATRKNGFAEYRLLDEGLRNLIHCIENNIAPMVDTTLPTAQDDLAATP